jgi:predicted DNA-binding transcriptional regulator AlpA
MAACDLGLFLKHPVPHMATRAEIASRVPVVLGLAAPEAAAAIGISATKFLALVKAKRMPRPRRLDSRLLWDVDELRDAFKALPHDEGEDEPDTWADFQ